MKKDWHRPFNIETGEKCQMVSSHWKSWICNAGNIKGQGLNWRQQCRPARSPTQGTAVLLCLNESDGSLCWQLVVPRIEGDSHNDWPMIGICSPPTIEGDRVYVLTNRSEVLCLDLNGQADGNDGTFQGEGWYMARSGEFPYEVTLKDADIIWMYDLKLELGLCPHDSPHASILIDGDFLYLNTCNGVNFKHLETTALNAPSLIALDKKQEDWSQKTMSISDPVFFTLPGPHPHGSRQRTKTGVFRRS